MHSGGWPVAAGSGTDQCRSPAQWGASAQKALTAGIAHGSRKQQGWLADTGPEHGATEQRSGGYQTIKYAR